MTCGSFSKFLLLLRPAAFFDSLKGLPQKRQAFQCIRKAEAPGRLFGRFPKPDGSGPRLLWGLLAGGMFG